VVGGEWWTASFGTNAALATAMGKLAKDGDLRTKLGEAGAARARKEFSFEHMTDKYDELYDHLVGRGS
jgi:glycosyltransferase involved in cell wall biosynthesis